MDNVSVKTITLEELTLNSNTRLRESIRQKDVLIKSLKGTIDNLTNVICNNSSTMLKVNNALNENIRNEANELFLDKYFLKMEKYIKDIDYLTKRNHELNLKLDELSKDAEISTKSYNVISSTYIDSIKKNKGEKKILYERIANLTKTMDSIKELHDNKMKNLRIYYNRELNKSNGIKCIKCYNEIVTTLFIPCNHMVMCDKCITSSKNDSEDKIECPKCLKIVEDKININF